MNPSTPRTSEPKVPEGFAIFVVIQFRAKGQLFQMPVRVVDDLDDLHRLVDEVIFGKRPAKTAGLHVRPHPDTHIGFLTDEQAEDPELREAFLGAITAYHRWRQGWGGSPAPTNVE